MLEINVWSRLKPPLFKRWVLDTGKEINAQAFIQGNVVHKIMCSVIIYSNRTINNIICIDYAPLYYTNSPYPSYSNLLHYLLVGPHYQCDPT